VLQPQRRALRVRRANKRWRLQSQRDKINPPSQVASAAIAGETIFSDRMDFWYSAVRDNGRLREPEASMDGMELRPLSTGEILDRTFTLYRRNFLLFLGISAIPHVLVLILNLLRVSVTFSSVRLPTILHSPQAAATAPPDFGSLTGIMVGAIIGMMVLVVSVIAYLLSQGGTVFAVSEIYLGRSTTIAESFRRVSGELLRLFGVVVLNGLATFAAFLCFIIPGFYILCRLIVCVPAALVEDIGARESLERSLELTRDNAGRAFVVLLLYFAVSIAAAALFAWPFTIMLLVVARKDPSQTILWMQLMQVGSFVGNVLVTPILTIASAILYYDLRVRKEAFDIQLMMNPMGGTAPLTNSLPTMFS
jgi:hypothetical protein